MTEEPNPETPPENDSAKAGLRLTGPIAASVAIAVALGLALDNWLLGIALGMGVGVAGHAAGSKKTKEPDDASGGGAP